MLVVTALGGNALLRRGEAMTAENQRRNVRIAAEALAPVANQHQLVIGHGNGPQVGLLALQGAAYNKIETYPFDVLGAQTEGMIGYMIEQELGNLLPFERPFATLLTMIEVDPADPAFKNPTKFIGPVYGKEEADRLAAEKQWVFKQDGDKWRRVVPSPMPKRIFSTCSSRGESVDKTRRVFSSSERLSVASCGFTAFLSSMKSESRLSSSSPTGDSRLIGSLAILSTMRTLSTGKSICWASSSGMGSRPSVCTR